MQQLNKAIQDCPAEENFPTSVAQYNRYREALSVLDGVAMYGRRVIVPAGLRSEVLQCLHSGHQGTSKMNERALQVVFWPGITNDIERIRKGVIGVILTHQVKLLFHHFHWPAQTTPSRC